MNKPLKIATRSSPLALKQVDLVMAEIIRAHPEYAAEGAVEVVPLQTSGDRFMDAKLADIGGKGLFTKEIDEALLSGRADIAVHSAKDMQTTLPEGLVFQAALKREDARDVLVSHALNTLNTLPKHARVGTSSLRRGIILKHKRPDISIEPIRGNIQTRLKKIEAGEYDATILAYAGIKRMRIDPLPGTLLELDDMLPAPAQGVIAIQCRAGDTGMEQLLARINHAPTMLAAYMERRMLALLDGSCRTPIAAYAEADGNAIYMRALLGDEKTMDVRKAEARFSHTEAEQALAHMAGVLKG